jgi:tRNA-dihydrouridine synthase
MLDHFHHLSHFRNERAAVCEFRKRVSWYSKQMHPCRPLKDGMQTIQSAADFERVMREFLEWRLAHDDEVRAGKREADELVEVG